ncbi:MAG: cytochrome c3 family protein [Blastocatellia bacterium]
MRNLKLILILLAVVIVPLSLIAQQRKTPARDRRSVAGLAVFRGNQCVACHAKLTEPLLVSAHFYEWLNSDHRQHGVSCDRCHGGDPGATDYKRAHAGVLAATFATSTLHPKNLPRTCGACHEPVVNAFTRSRHFQQLQETGAGPSCTTCHAHMATKVIRWPPETAIMCAGCHRDQSSAAGNHPEIPERALETIAAFSRAEEVLSWTRRLMREAARGRKYNPRGDAAEIGRLEQELRESRLAWHAFDLGESRRKADFVFTQGTRIKDEVWKRVP